MAENGEHMDDTDSCSGRCNCRISLVAYTSRAWDSKQVIRGIYGVLHPYIGIPVDIYTSQVPFLQRTPQAAAPRPLVDK